MRRPLPEEGVRHPDRSRFSGGGKDLAWSECEVAARETPRPDGKSAGLQDDASSNRRFTLRPESSHSLPGSASAEMSAARKVKYLKELFIVVRDCTYICVHGSVPVGTLLQTADVFLREHFRQGAAPYAWASGQRGRLSPQERCRTRADECVRRSRSRFHPRRPGRLSPHRFTRRLR